MSRTSIQPREDGCYVHFHPTTIRVMRAIEDNLDHFYDVSWRDIAAIAGVSVSTLYRHLDVLERAMYIERGDTFGDTICTMSLDMDLSYECEGE